MPEPREVQEVRELLFQLKQQAHALREMVEQGKIEIDPALALAMFDESDEVSQEFEVILALNNDEEEDNEG